MKEETKAGERRPGILYQVSLLQSLAYGEYDGILSVGELKRHGDTGLGTLHGLNGELILVDGEAFRAGETGRVERVSDHETTPFAAVTVLREDGKRELSHLPDEAALVREWEKMGETGKNGIYFLRIDGLFSRMRVRSVPAQEKPYGRLVEVLSREQTVFDFEEMEGTVVALYCPPYLADLNAAGWHMHFISRDRAVGGHVLGMGIRQATMVWSNLHQFQLEIPSGEAFHRLDLAVDQSREIETIEKSS